MYSEKQREFNHLQQQLRQLGISPAIDQSLADCIVNRDQQFRIRAYWHNKGERLHFDLRYYKLDGAATFALDHYRVGIRRDIPIPSLQIGGVDTRDLEKRMQGINWGFMAPAEDCTVTFKSQPEFIGYIQQIYADIQHLGKTEDGTKAQLLLQAKYLSQHQDFGDQLQSQLDLVDAAYLDELIVPVRGRAITHMQDSFQLLRTGDEPARQLSASHEIYFVSSFKFSPVGKNLDDPIALYEKIRFFSSFEKAFAYSGICDEELRTSTTLASINEELPIGRLVISDCRDNATVADKTCFTTPELGAERKITGWNLSTMKMPAHEFAKRTGVPLQNIQIKESSMDDLSRLKSEKPPGPNVRSDPGPTKKRSPGFGHGL